MHISLMGCRKDVRGRSPGLGSGAKLWTRRRALTARSPRYYASKTTVLDGRGPRRTQCRRDSRNTPDGCQYQSTDGVRGKALPDRQGAKSEPHRAPASVRCMRLECLTVFCLSVPRSDAQNPARDGNSASRWPSPPCISDLSVRVFRVGPPILDYDSPR